MMRILTIFVIICWFHSSCIDCHLILIGSNLTPTSSNYKVYLTGANLTDDAIVNVTLKSSTNHETYKVFEDVSENFFHEVSFQLPDLQNQEYKLSVVQASKSSDFCKKKSTTIINNSKHHMIFIQLDKPIYSNGDEVKFRVFILNENLQPFSFKNMNLVMTDGNGNEIISFNKIRSTEYGVIENSLKIAEKPNFGSWKIQVEVDGKKTSKEFEVQNKNDGSFDVLIDVPKEVAFINRKVYMSIIIKHSIEKFFTGNAKISASARFLDANESSIKNFLKMVNIQNEEKHLVFDIQDDIGIKFPSADMIITFEVEVIEDKTLKSKKAIVDIHMRHKGSNIIIVDRKPYFRPGFDFPIKVKVKDLNGRPDASFNSLEMIVDYQNIRKGPQMPIGDVKTFNINLRNGQVYAPLHPTVDTRKIVVNFKFAGTELKEEIDALPGVIDEFMQAEVLSSSMQIGDAIQIEAKTSGMFEALNVFVIGQFGLVYANSYSEASGKDIFNFSMTLTQEMRPESHLVVFYVRSEDGAIIYDDITLRLGFSVENSLSISSIDMARPNEVVTLNVKSEKGSKVFLTAVDKNSALISRKNQITRSDVYNEIVRYMTINAANNNSNNPFENYNAFVLQPMIDGVACNKNDDPNGPLSNEQNKLSISEKLLQKYIPDIWFDDSFDIANDEIQTIEKQLPNKITSWKIIGMSIHPTKGLSVSKGSNVMVNSDLALKVHAPESMHFGEILKVEYSALNFLKTSQSSNIHIRIENGELVNEKIATKFNRYCRTYQQKNQSTLSHPLQLSADSVSEMKSIYIKPHSVGAMKIKITATSETDKDEVEKEVEIKSRKNLEKKVHRTYIIDLENNGSIQNEISLNLEAGEELISNGATLSGNLIGPVLNNLDKLSKLPTGIDPLQMYKFAASLVATDFLNHSGSDIKFKIYDDLLKGYQEMFAIVNNNEIQNMSAWTVAYIADTLIEARKYRIINDKSIEILLDNLKSRQKIDGSFSDNSDSNIRREMGLYSSQTQILTANIFLTFFKFQPFNDKYETVVANSFKYLKSTMSILSNDYEKVIVAHSFAYSGNLDASKILLKSLDNNFRKPVTYKKHISMFIEIASYLILTKLLHNDDPTTEVEWLISHKNADGSFYSPHDSILTMKALNEYSKLNRPDATNLSYNINGQNVLIPNQTAVTNLKLAPRTIQTLKVTGSGLGYASVYYEYYSQHKQTQSYFKIDVTTTSMLNDMIDIHVDVELKVPDILSTNLVVIEIQLPSGYQFIGLSHAEHIQNIELKNDRNLVYIFIKKIEARKIYSQVIKAVRVYEIENLAESIVMVYDYYRPNVRDITKYIYDFNYKSCKEIEDEQRKEDEDKKMCWFWC